MQQPLLLFLLGAIPTYKMRTDRSTYSNSVIEDLLQALLSLGGTLQVAGSLDLLSKLNTLRCRTQEQSSYLLVSNRFLIHLGQLLLGLLVAAEIALCADKNAGHVSVLLGPVLANFGIPLHGSEQNLMYLPSFQCSRRRWD